MNSKTQRPIPTRLMNRHPKAFEFIPEGVPEPTVFIYVLLDPRWTRVYYVGQTRDLTNRYQGHLRAALNPDASARDQWLSRLLAQKLTPRMIVIDEVSMGRANDVEMAWIKYYSRMNAHLCNTHHCHAPTAIKKNICLTDAEGKPRRLKLTSLPKGRVAEYMALRVQNEGEREAE